MLATPAFSEPHVHGNAQLQVAIENDQIDLIFSSPAANLLGFEHAPTTAAQTRTLQNAVTWLQSQPLVSPGSGSCDLVEAVVQSDLINAQQVTQPAGSTAHAGTPEDHHQSGHEKESGHEKDHRDHHNEAHDEHQHDRPDAIHTDFLVTQTLRCDADLSAGLTTPLLAKFGGIEKLQIQWVRDSTQGSLGLSRQNSASSFAN